VLGKTGLLFTVGRRCFLVPQDIAIASFSSHTDIDSSSSSAWHSVPALWAESTHTTQLRGAVFWQHRTLLRVDVTPGFNTRPGWSPARPMEDLTIPAAEFQGREPKGRLHARQTSPVVQERQFEEDDGGVSHR
jgi:hypothetical protein